MKMHHNAVANNSDSKRVNQAMLRTQTRRHSRRSDKQSLRAMLNQSYFLEYDDSTSSVYTEDTYNNLQ